jgi:hypothetical protein
VATCTIKQIEMNNIQTIGELIQRLSEQDAKIAQAEALAKQILDGDYRQINMALTVHREAELKTTGQASLDEFRSRYGYEGPPPSQTAVTFQITDYMTLSIIGDVISKLNDSRKEIIAELQTFGIKV